MKLELVIGIAVVVGNVILGAIAKRQQQARVAQRLASRGGATVTPSRTPFPQRGAVPESVDVDEIEEVRESVRRPRPNVRPSPPTSRPPTPVRAGPAIQRPAPAPPVAPASKPRVAPGVVAPRPAPKSGAAQRMPAARRPIADLASRRAARNAGRERWLAQHEADKKARRAAGIARQRRSVSARATREVARTKESLVSPLAQSIRATFKDPDSARVAFLAGEIFRRLDE